MNNGALEQGALGRLPGERISEPLVKRTDLAQQTTGLVLRQKCLLQKAGISFCSVLISQVSLFLV